MKKIIVLFILLGILFVSSAQTYEQQSLIPTLKEWLPDKPLEASLSKLQVPYWGKTISIEERGYYHFVEFLLRKSAHFFIFGILATVIYSLLPKHAFRMLTATIITLLFAIGDEYHQSLTGGRTPTVNDVILDMSGAITFLLLLRLLLWVKPKLRKKARIH
ncbi:VanZ family protein [Sporosarcina soli]|uniref:VanZ family protein n=1 Tax=Sporosarcina soli TaxID=334736 RepID=A0ABW0TJK9_9BACL